MNTLFPVRRIASEQALLAATGAPLTISLLSWAVPALLAGAKTVTRQVWTPRHARRFRAGMRVLLTGALPTSRSRPVPLAIARIVEEPVLEPLRQIPDSDYAAEGWQWMSEHPEAIERPATAADFTREAFDRWRNRNGELWVVRFEVLEQLVELVPVAESAPTGDDARQGRIK